MALLSIMLTLVLLQAHSYADVIRGCYYTNWAQYRQDKGKYMPEDYSAGLCTHIFYAFAVMNEDFTIKPFEWNDENTDWSAGMYSRVLGLKKIQPDLRVILSFGGWTFSEQNVGLLRKMASSSANRQKFIQSVVQLVKKYKFDGFDLDWEYPTAEDKADFAQLLRDLRAAFDAQTPRLILTAAVAANPQKIVDGYDRTVMAQTVDMVNVMSYDFHGAWETTTGFNSPLTDRNNDHFSVKDAAEAWVQMGVPLNKIMIGLATYGRGWTLAGADKGVGAAASGPSKAGLYTRADGVLAYYELCDLLAKGATRIFDTQQSVPYLVVGDQWHGYEDVESIDIKLAWIKERGFGGAFVWALDFDDFRGTCASSGYKRFPLTSRIKDILVDGKQPLTANNVTYPPAVFTTPSTAPPAIVTTPSAVPSTIGTTPSTAPPKIGTTLKSTTVASTPFGVQSSVLPFQCTVSGLFPDPSDCRYFYDCVSSGSFYRIPCPTGLRFNPQSKTCDWPNNVACKGAGLR